MDLVYQSGNMLSPPLCETLSEVPDLKAKLKMQGQTGIQYLRKHVQLHIKVCIYLLELLLLIHKVSHLPIKSKRMHMTSFIKYLKIKGVRMAAKVRK